MKLSRRGFVKFSAGSAAGLGLSGLSLKTLSVISAAASEEIYPPRGPESFANSICQLCPGGCGLTVRKIGPRAVRVQGNKNSPINRGGLCPIGVASLQYLYHPARLNSPLKRVGHEWETLSWEQAFEEIASHLGSLIERGDSERVVLLSHPLRGVLKQAVKDLMKGMGSSNTIELSGPGDGIEVAARLMQGVRQRPAYDLAHCNYVLSIGCEMLEDWTSPVWAMKQFSQFRGKRPRGRLTYAGSRESVTASKADTWIRLRPGTEGIFALGVAYVLISERMYDFQFIRSHCLGFEDWKDEQGQLQTGFRNLVLEHYPLSRVAERTGVATEQILQVAREFGATHPAVALAGTIELPTTHSVLSALAIHSLNALAGSIDRKGGVLQQYPGPLDEIDGESGNERPSLLADFKQRTDFGEDPLRIFEEVLQEDRNLPTALLLLETDPIYDSSNPEALRQRLNEVPLIISISSFLNATSELADYVLPAASFLESWVEQPAPPGVPFAYEGLAQPILEPVGDSRSCGDIVLGLARALKIPAQEGDYASLVQDRLTQLYQLKRGSVAGTVFDQLWQQLMEQSGWWAPTYETPGQLLKQMKSRGGWWDSFYRYEDWSRVLATSSGKFKFHIPEIQVSQDSGSKLGKVFHLPYSRPVSQASERDYPFLVNFFDPLTARSRQPGLPWVREVAGGLAQNRVGVWVELGEHDASQLGIRSGNRVWIESPGSRIQAFARILPTVPHGVVNIPRGVDQAAGTWSRVSGRDGPTLIDNSGAATRVRIARTGT